MKKIKLFPAPRVEVKIYVSDEMVADMRECMKGAKSLGNEKECDSCSWNEVSLNGDGFCELPMVIEKILGKLIDEECFIPEPDNPYPLCIGRGKPECGDCCQYMHYEDKSGCGPNDKMEL